MSIAEAIWFPTLVSSSNQLISMDHIASRSLALVISKGDESTRVNVIFEETFINKCPDMSFWSYPFDRFRYVYVPTYLEYEFISSLFSIWPIMMIDCYNPWHINFIHIFPLSCTFYLRHRDLPSNRVNITGTVYPRPELWTPSKIHFTPEDAKSDMQTIHYLTAKYSTTGFIITFERLVYYDFSK